MQIIFLSLLAMVISSGQLLANDCVVSDVGRCTFYLDCVEEVRPCGVEGYAIAYGYKYCNIFKSAEFKREMTTLWRNKTLKCLQLELLDYNVLSKSCREIKDYAYDSHPGCYVQPDPIHPEISICNINRFDVLEVFSMIRARDSLSRQGFRQIREVARLCYSTLSKDKVLDDDKLERLLFWESQLFEGS